jgi:branched-chain amino acid transport system substrate-binding protein
MSLTGSKTILGYVLIVFAALQLVACGQKDPVTLGFVGGLTGRVSDLGGPARNGMLLAIEEANKAGGINGQPIKAIIHDDRQDVETAKKVVNELIAKNVDAIVGPATSSMAVKVAPLAEKAKTIMMGVTVTTNSLTGKDDYFFRVLAATAVHAGEVAEHLFEKENIRRFSTIYDLKNKAYSLGWVTDFTTRMNKLGGESINTLSFTSGNQEELVPLASKLVEGEPDIVIFVTNAVDAALLAKLVRTNAPTVKLGTSEWAGTERLIELGGSFVEGAFVPQYLDRESKDPDYLSFREAFIRRFNHEPGFPGLTAYNATNVVLDRLKHKSEGQSLKDAILEKGVFSGIQGTVRFDKYGDAMSKTFVTRIINNKFVVQSK